MPSKVLHIVESLHRGAVENWLLRMLRHARKSGMDADWTFYCILGSRGSLDDEARALGARVIHSPVPLNQKASFVQALRGELQSGEYDVLHCHHDLMSALYLLAAVGVRLRCRIVHVHNADENVPTPSRVKQLLFRRPLRWICLGLADKIVGISNHTLDTFLADRARRPGRDVVHYYGIDPDPFTNIAADRSMLRRDLDLADDAPILLFAGRVVPEKNPAFVINVLTELRRLEPKAVAVFAGAGAAEQEVLRRAREAGVGDSVRMLGWRDDLAPVMSRCDWFILPRHEHPMEGFGLAVVEAQLAGLRMLLSEGIPDDPLLPTAVFCRLSLKAGAQAWAEAAMDLRSRTPSPQSVVLAALRESGMDMDRSLNALMGLYQ